MNDDDSVQQQLETLRAEHQQLDQQIAELTAQPSIDQIHLARLKRRKLHLKDQIQRILDNRTPDIIA